MKKTLLLLCMVLISAILFSQKVIKNPSTGFSTAGNVSIKQIQLLDTVTVVDFRVTVETGNWMSVPKQTYIQPDGEGKKYFVSRAEGIPLVEKYVMGKAGFVEYSLYFPPISQSTEFVDFGEANDGGSWFIYDIKLSDRKIESEIPKKIQGNWCNKETQLWEISFYENNAIYDKKLWTYNAVNLKKANGVIELKASDGTLKTLLLSKGKSGWRIGTSKDKLVGIVKQFELKDKPMPADDAMFEEPFFKIDSAIYTGIIKDYTPRYGIKTFKLFINNAIIGDQKTHIISINPDGTFYTKVPLYCPCQVLVSSDFYRNEVFLEPGKTLFHVLSNKMARASFMGELARVNNDLLLLDNVYSFDYRVMQDTILSMSADEYKAYVLDYLQKDLTTLDTLCKNLGIGKKAFTVKQLELNQQYASMLAYYTSYFKSAYRKKHNIPRAQRELDIDLEPLSAEYFDFLTNEFVNNPLGPTTFEYYFFINRIKYCDLVSYIQVHTNKYEIVEQMVKEGYEFRDDELKIIAYLRAQDELTNLPEVKRYREQHGANISAFYNEHKAELTELRGTYFSFLDFVNLVKEKGNALTPDEKILIGDSKKYYEIDEVKRMNEFAKENYDSITVFLQLINDNLKTNNGILRSNKRAEMLRDKLGIKPGFALDFMFAQDQLRSIAQEYTPVGEEKLKQIQSNVSNPFIAEYIAYCNEATKAKIEAQKFKTGFTKNEIPKTEADKLFDAIMAKYKGKVVYVDFWATWCGPCRSGIERIKPLKETMDSSKVVFVYITGQSSPENTWNNMIPDIKGEHYRVSKDEWNYLCDKFDVSGIPHYALVDKNGNVVNPDLPHMQNKQIETLLTKEIEK